MGDLAIPIRSLRRPALGGRSSSDERLARLVSGGSTWAFGLLYQRHHQALYRYCRSIVHDEEDARDALQDAMIRALAALRGEERDLAVRPWLFRVVHNEAVSLMRRRRSEATLEECPEPCAPGVEHVLEGHEQLATLVRDLRALGERQRAALVMRELSGLSIEEIAAVLSTSPGAAKQTLFEARCAMHDFVEGRAMECERVRRTISDGDGRVLRGRKIRGHLRECRGCRDFERTIATRGAALRALAPPLPPVAASAMLSGLIAHGAGSGHAGGLTAMSGAAVGKPAVSSLAAKALVAGLATVAAAGGARLVLSPDRHAGLPAPAAKPADLSSWNAGAGTPARGGRVIWKAFGSGSTSGASTSALARVRARASSLAGGRAISTGAFAAGISSTAVSGPGHRLSRGHGLYGRSRHGSGAGRRGGQSTVGSRGAPRAHRGGTSSHQRAHAPGGGERSKPVHAEGAPSGKPGPPSAAGARKAGAAPLVPGTSRQTSTTAAAHAR
jgi:RNA polymerase sigma factor (sigma-70 family)